MKAFRVARDVRSDTTAHRVLCTGVHSAELVVGIPDRKSELSTTIFSGLQSELHMDGLRHQPVRLIHLVDFITDATFKSSCEHSHPTVAPHTASPVPENRIRLHSFIMGEVNGTGSKPLHGLKVLLIGAGFGGLASASELQERGATIKVLELSPDMKRQGR